MGDLMQKYTAEYLAKFDMVMAHAFNMLRSNQKGAELPSFMEITLHNKAKEYALALHRLSVKDNIPYIDLMYQRIVKGEF